MKNSNIRVLIVEDTAMTSMGIRDYLTKQGMDVREVSNAASAIQLVEEWAPQAVVLDIVIPPRGGEEDDRYDSEGIRVAQTIKERDPDIGIVLFSNFDHYGREVLDLAQRGYGGLVYLYKAATSPRDLLEAIHQALAGDLRLDPKVSRRKDQRPIEISRFLASEELGKVEYAVSHFSELTETEYKVVELIVASRSTKGTAAELCVSPNTVTKHLNSVYSKLGLSEENVGALLDQRSLLTKAYIVHRSRQGSGR